MEWQFVGLGDFYGTDTSDMILRNSGIGAFEVYNISNNDITNAASLVWIGISAALVILAARRASGFLNGRIQK